MAEQADTRAGGERRFFAALAHQRAGQVIALRAAAERIERECTTAEQATEMVRAIAKDLEHDIGLMGLEGGRA